MKVYDDEIVSDDVCMYLEQEAPDFGRDQDSVYLAYSCGCKWTREKTSGRGYMGVTYLCFRHEVIELAAREGTKDEARRRSAADRDGAPST